MTALTRVVLRHRAAVIAAWLVVSLVGVALLPTAVGSLSHRFDVPGREGFATNALMLRELGTGGPYPPLVLVLALPDGRRADARPVAAALERATRRAARAAGSARYATHAGTGDPALLSADGRTTFALVFVRPDPEQPDGNLEAAHAVSRTLEGTRIADRPLRVSGIDALRSDTGSEGGIGVLLETLIGALGALVVLAVVFRSALALLPLAIAGVSITVTYLAIWGLTAFGSVSFLVEFFVALVGLGVAIDYSLLIASRWRQERLAGADNDAAVTRAMETAGSAVVTSGTTVALGLLALIAVPLGFLRSVGVAGMLISFVSAAAATTLLPAVLAAVGPRLEWPRLRRTRADVVSPGWQRWAQGVVRHRWVALVTGVVLLGALAVAAFQLQPGNPSPHAIGHGTAAQQGVAALDAAQLGTGALTPIEVLAEPSRAAAVARRLARVEGVATALAVDAPGWRNRRVAIVSVLPRADASTAAGAETLERVRATTASLPAVHGVGGRGAQNADFVDAVYGSFPLMLAAIGLVTFVLLARALSSVLLPLKAIAMNLLSVAATWGALVLFWQQGHGAELLGLEAAGSITAWVPLIVFAFLYGISMDYEIFILARIREEHADCGDTDEAIVRGMARTGPLVTGAALILVFAFAAMSASPDTDVKIAASGLAFGLLIDATVVRCLLVPASVSLFGAANWWMPGPLARLLRPSRARSRDRVRVR